jgi:hypothetical protein
LKTGFRGIEWLSARISSRKMLADLIEKVGLETFEKLAVNILEYRRTGRLLLDLSLTRSLLGAESEIFQELSNKYKIDKADVRNSVNALSYLLREVITTKRERLIESFSRDEKILDKAIALVEVGERLIYKYPEIRERFYLTTFSKTSYLGDIDWEIVIKVVEPPIYEFEEKDRFPACILRFLLEKPSTIMRPLFPEEPVKEFVFEASLNDINRLIGIFSEIKNKLMEINKDLVEGRAGE